MGLFIFDQAHYKRLSYGLEKGKGIRIKFIRLVEFFGFVEWVDFRNIQSWNQRAHHELNKPNLFFFDYLWLTLSVDPINSIRYVCVCKAISPLSFAISISVYAGVVFSSPCSEIQGL